MSAAAVAPAPTSPSNNATAASVVLTKSEDVSSEKKPAAAATAKENNCTSSSSNVESKETATAKTSTQESTVESPLPADLHMILNEVARTGKCPWLSWNGKDSPEAPMPSDMLQAATTSSVASSKASSVGSRSVLAKHRSSAFSSISSSHKPPARKKLRNGVSRRSRYSSTTTENGSSLASTTAGRKRPLYLSRTPSTTGSTFSASSIGSGRTSGSEVEDSTQYECDSEGTSATTNSELSRDEKRAARKRVIIQTSPGSSMPIMNHGNATITTCKTLRAALRSALSLVLDHSYCTRGGYKLSPAELRIHAAAVAAQTAASNAIAAAAAAADGGSGGGSEKENSPELADLEPPSPEKTFLQRKRRLLALLGDDSLSDASEAPPHSPLHHHGPSYLGGGVSEFHEGPPFTIQRIAEVLVAPERYYKQTHKLCNCLEKLLLVTSPASSFGEGNGVETSPSKGGDNELTVVSDKKGRQDLELRSNKRLRRRMSSSDASSDDESGHKTSPQHEKPTDELMASTSPDTKEVGGDKDDKEDQGIPSNGSEMSSKEILEAAARAQLRSKFDHVGIDPHSSSAVDRSVPGIPNRGLTSSPPPPGLASAAALSPHGGVSGFARHVGDHSPGSGDSSADSVPHPSTVQQNPMPFFSAANNETAKPIPAVHADSHQNISMLQMHHEAALSSSGSSAAAAAVRNPLIELVVGPEASAPSSADVADLDVEPSGRSSASNSDVDSESDDFYLDDSASDRSDGSDSGHSEPFTAARVMALNRIQQQRARREQQTTLHYQHGLGFRPPLDTEYQSGDSIDSTMAEDSCGSDSSSASDLAD